MAHDTFRVVLIGRTNVGKSTFFSRITDVPSVTSHIKHTTRDAREGRVEWNSQQFTLIDTGGFDITRHEPYAKEITERITRELQVADIVLLMTDVLDPLPREESEWLRALSRKHKKIIVIANKVDKPRSRLELTGQSTKGVPVFACSSTNGGGVGDVLEAIIAHMPHATRPDATRQFRLGLVGRTNVGKSSLLNALAGEPLAIVSNQHHTTREPIAVTLPFRGTHIEIIDTAGAIRRPQEELARRVSDLTDSIIKTCDVLALVVEYHEHPIPSHDLQLVDVIIANKKSLMLVVNKWDLESDRSHIAAQDELRRIKRAFASIPFVPILLTSATRHVHIRNILATASTLYQERFVELTDAQCKNIQFALSDHVSSFRQLEVDPPRFHAVATSRTVPRAMTDLLHKKIRETHPYLGTPIIVSLAKHTRRNASRSRVR